MADFNRAARDRARHRGAIGFLTLAAAFAFATSALGAAASLPPYRSERAVEGMLASIGDAAMASIMDAWLTGFRERQPAIGRGVWNHRSDASAVGALMFELADMAPLAREPHPAELAPYDHQFKGDMMKAPLLIRVATFQGRPAYIAVNKRPGAPIPQRVKEFISFALSREGQQIAGRQTGFIALDAATAASEAARLDTFLARLDPELPIYRPVPARGEISSVGSDGMKTLVDRWQRDFRRLQPEVRKGERWEHLGTLNGFHALLANEADIAPMGRELWPQERAAYQAVLGTAAPFEIRVARGGFNTPQRTTAQAIFVHKDNPLARLSLPQLRAIMGEGPAITRWGQLGLAGEWADRPIRIYMPPRAAPNAMSMQMMVLGGNPWNGAAREAPVADTAAAIAADRSAIGFGGFEEGGPGLKTVAVAKSDRGPYIAGDAANVSAGLYPLARYMYVRLNRRPGEPLRPAVREFLRYILSRDGQEPILYSGYFPLTAAEVSEELAKLE